MSLSGPFLFDPRAFWGDENVRLMSGEQVAAYLKLLSLQWENGSLPADPEKLASLMSEGKRAYSGGNLVGGGYVTGQRDREPFRDELLEGTLEAPLEGSLWEGLKPCFRVVDRRLWNERLDEEREDWIRKQVAMSEGGKKGGKRSAKARSKRLRSASRKASPPSSPPSKGGSRGAESTSSFSGSLPSSNPKETRTENPQKDSLAADAAVGDLNGFEQPAAGAARGGGRLAAKAMPAGKDLEAVRGEDPVPAMRGQKASHVAPPAAGTEEPGGGGRTDAQKISRILGELAEAGVEDVRGLWKERLRCTVASKRPNRARQLKQLSKIAKGLENGHAPSEAVALLELAADRGWSGIEWRYLENDRDRGSSWKGKSLPAAPNSSGKDRGIDC